MKRLLYVGCLGYGNLGDEACWSAGRALLEPRLPPGWTLDAVNGYDFRDDEAFDALVLGGGTLLSPHGNLGDAALREARERGVPYFVFGSGTESAEWEGAPEDRALERFRALLTGAELLGVRGPLSRRYLASLGIPAARIQVVGDLALALETPRSGGAGPPTELGGDAGPWVGVNVGTSFGRVYGGDEERAMETLGEVLEHLDRRGWRPFLFPVWDRDIETQKRVAEGLGLTRPLASLERVPKAGDLLGILEHVDAVIAFKLHAGIFSAMARTPYLPWAYRPKVEDFARSVGVERFIVRTDASADVLLAAFEALTVARESVTARLDRGVAALRRRLETFADVLAVRLSATGSASRRSS